MNDQLVERIYDMHESVVRRLVRKGVDISEAPDLAVSVLLDAVGALHQLKDPGKLEPWVMTIANNAASRYFKERAKCWEKETSVIADCETGEEIDIYDVLADEMTVEKVLRKAEKTAMVGVLLSCLGKKEKTIFLMHNLEEMRFREIAAQLELNENTVRSIHSRSCVKLKKYSEEMYGKEANCD